MKFIIHRHFKALLVALAIFPFAAFATNVDVTGNIKTSGGNIFTDTGSIYASAGFVRAQTYFYTPGYVQAGAYGTFGTTLTAGGAITGATVQGTSWLYTPGYMAATGAGYIGDFMRIGGAANTPASKSVQIGQYATTDSFNSLVVGQYNLNKAKDGVTAPSPTTWRDGTGGTPIDPLFVVGNGTSTTPKNAFAIYKDGTVTMSQAQGDILMGQFGN